MKIKNILGIIAEIIAEMKLFHWDYNISKKWEDKIENINIKYLNGRMHITFIVPKDSLQNVPKMCGFCGWTMESRSNYLEMYISKSIKGFCIVTIKIPVSDKDIDKSEYREVKRALEKIEFNLYNVMNDYLRSLKKAH